MQIGRGVRTAQLVGLALLMGCAGAKRGPAPASTSGFASPRYEFRGISFEDPSFSGMRLTFKYELVSEDARPAKLVACPFRLQLEGMEPLSGTINQEGELGGNARLMVTTPVGMPWPKTRDEVMQLLARKGVKYTFTQDCNLEGPEGGLTVSGADSGVVPLPRLPQMTVSGANAQHIGSEDTKLSFELSILNENTFPVRVDKVTYAITLEGKPLAQGELPVGESIPANNETTFDIPTEVRSGEASKELLDLVKRPTIAYRLEGMVYMGNFEIPVAGDGTISFAH